MAKKPSLLQRAWSLRQASPATWFAIVALCFSLAFTLLTPPFATPDEHNHFFRSYQIASGRLLPEKLPDDQGTGGWMPISVVRLSDSVGHFTPADLNDVDDIKVEPGKRFFARFENTALYSPVAYLPQALGILVGKLAGLPLVYLTYLARIATAVVYAALLYAAIRFLPFGKWAAVVLGLLPMHVLLAGTTSADPIAIGLAALTIAVVLRLRKVQRTLSRKEQLLVLGLVAALSLVKLPFVLFAVLFVLVPRKVFGKKTKDKLVGLGAIALTAAVFGGGWLVTAKLLSSPYGPAAADPDGQIHFLIGHPFGFLHILYNSFLTEFSNTVVQQYVVSIGLLQSWMPLWASYLYTIFLTLALFPLRARAGTLSRIEKAFVAGLGLLCFLAISALLFVSWTVPGAAILDGIQVRYFTPLLFLLIPILAVRTRSKQQADGMLPVWCYRWVPVGYLTFALGLTIAWFY